MLRPLLESDKAVIDEWIARDPDHVARHMTEEFFRKPGSMAFAIDDAHGPVMYVRVDPLDAEIVQLHIQFDNRERLRNARALVRDFPTVCERVRQASLRYIIFDSVSESLIRFCQKRFHFIRIADSDYYQLDIKAGP